MTNEGHTVTHWTGSNGDFRYNVIMTFLIYQTCTTKTKTKNVKLKLSAYMHNVALTPLVTCF